VTPTKYAFALLAITSAAGCTPDADFQLRYAPDFRREARTVSFLGVYRDGRMSAEAWDDLAPKLAPAFGGGSCEVVYGDALLKQDPDLASAVDDAARADGVTDDLAALFAPAASADTIAFFTITGLPSRTLPKTRTGSATGAGASASSPATMRGGAGRRSGMGGNLGGPTHIEGGERKEAFEVSLTLYSVKEKRTVGVVAMSYNGKDPDAGVSVFLEKVRAELPNARCLGWKPDVHVEADQVKKLTSS
jgi:hypothetical protein